jgi:hypothetical protein
LRDSEGYVKTWYDKDNDNGYTKTYKFAPKKVNGTIYVTVENYPYLVVHGACLTSRSTAFVSLVVQHYGYEYKGNWYDDSPYVISIPAS